MVLKTIEDTTLVYRWRNQEQRGTITDRPTKRRDSLLKQTATPTSGKSTRMEGTNST